MNDDETDHDERRREHDDHQTLREALGAYVLGQLKAGPDDTAPTEAAVRIHLAGCALCRTELAELQPVATALAGLRHRPVAGGPLPADLRPRLDAALANEAGRRHRGRLTRAVTGLVAAAALVAVTVLGVNAFRADAPSGPVPDPIAVQVVQTDEVTASAGIIRHTWGVEVKLTTAGLTEGERFDAFVTEDNGAEVPAGTFTSIGTATMNCNLQAAVLAEDAVGFDVRDQDGVVVLSGSF